MKSDRRGFLRWCALGAIVAGLGALVTRQPRETCVNQGLCRGCGAYNGCGLPQAQSMKEALRR